MGMAQRQVPLKGWLHEMRRRQLRLAKCSFALLLLVGIGSLQLLQAAEYYLQVQAANPDATITFTGHSLGVGLAALMGVFFGQRAVTFDQAPFANSAELSVLTPDVAAHLKAELLARGYSESALQGLTDFLNLRAATGGIPNSSLIDSINVQGKFLSEVPWNIPDRMDFIKMKTVPGGDLGPLAFRMERSTA